MDRQTFRRRGIVEGFFGPLWSMADRKALFEFGAARKMNSYLYAPKDDPYHRARWSEPYPKEEWRALVKLIRHADEHAIDFVYGFHPGNGLCFSAANPIEILLDKARTFYDVGVRFFAVLFDDIPSRLQHERDRKGFKNSLARAEGTWLRTIRERQPAQWKEVEWWICPSYYTPDPLLAHVFGTFEPDFLETLGELLPAEVACFWTGPSVVSKTITQSHLKRVAQRLRRPLMLWDNYPVNDLAMKDEMHLSPLTGRDQRLPNIADGYFANPLLQASLSYIPVATCLDYAWSAAKYEPERSWARAIIERFGRDSLPYWRAIRRMCEKLQAAKKSRNPVRLSRGEAKVLFAAYNYLQTNRNEKWARELRPWSNRIPEVLRERVISTPAI